ncbi:MAG: UpxY family transcription antiterminator [Muribaculaceae bacterium]|nr:UpxY family transcription antiterminator [Muribaculaceae bacterium]
MVNCSTSLFPAPETNVADDAVGVPGRKWYVAIVKHNAELKAAEQLRRLHYHTYVASQEEVRIRKNGRKVKVQRIVIPSKIFIFCTEQERRQIVLLPYILRFMTNIAGTSAPGMHKPLVTIPPYQIYILRFMLGQAEAPVEIVSRPYRKGQPIKVVRGKLSGLTGEIHTAPDGSDSLIISLDILGYATVRIDAADIAPL